MHSLWIYYLLLEFPLNQLWIYYLLRISTINSQFYSRIHYEFIIFFFNSFWIQYKFTIFTRIYYEFTIFFANPLWFHNLFREFVMNSLSLPRIYYDFTILTQTHYEFSFFSWICYELTILRAKTPWIHNLHREFRMNPLYFSRINYEFTRFFANSLWI